MRRCIVKVASSITFEGEKTENTFRVPGKFEEEMLSLTFNEKISGDPGAPSVKTTIVLGDEIKVYRNDRPQFLFKEGEESFCRYETVAGELELSVRTTKLSWEITDAGGALYMEYELSYDESSKSECLYGVTFEFAKR